MAMTTPTEPLDISRLDTLGMWDVTFGLADQLEAATRRVSDFLPGLPTVDELDHVVVMGMGGSGIAGDVLAALAGPSSPVPVVVVKDPAVPGVRRRRARWSSRCPSPARRPRPSPAPRRCWNGAPVSSR